MKTWMKVVLGIAAAVAILIGLVLYATSHVAETGDAFVEAAGKGEVDTAYGLLTPDFRSGTTKDELAAYLAAHSLDKATGASWSNRSFTNSEGRLEGTFATRDGGKVPITMDLISTDDGWRIRTIQVKPAGFQGGGAGFGQASTIPSPLEQVRLTNGITQSFIAALDDPDFSKFQSEWLHESISADSFENAFGKLRVAKERLAWLASMNPSFDEPAKIDEKGFLTYKGRYPGEELQYQFEYGLVPVGRGWKVIRFKVDLLTVS